MAEQFEKILDIDANVLRERLSETVILDNKENAKQYYKQGIYMGKIAAKKFYILYKPKHRRFYNYMTVLRGDLSSTEDGKTRLRYYFNKFKGAIFVASLLLLFVTAIAIYAFFSNATNVAGNVSILGFWIVSVLIYFYSIASSRDAGERLVDFIEDLSQK